MVEGLITRLPGALLHSLQHLPVQLSNEEIAEIIRRREDNARKAARQEAKDARGEHCYQETWPDLLRLARVMVLGRR